MPDTRRNTFIVRHESGISITYAENYLVSNIHSNMITSSYILPYISLFVGGWAVMNGILHDIFVLRSAHGKKYDRELLRLLMDGHILMTCGLMQMISFLGLRHNEPWSYYVAGVACMSLFTYCLLIFPFLKSFATMFLNLLLLAFLIFYFLH